MSKIADERKLATILFADIAGYTALMQDNESQALEMLTTFRQILDKEVSRFNGTLVQYYGDGSLLTFGSSTHSLNCAHALQVAFQRENIPVRIGIHLGEIIERAGNIFGDGVNVASRIESMSTPGAVLVSKSIRDQVKNQPVFVLQSLGNFHFKNVAESIEVFALAGEHIVTPSRDDLSEGKLQARSKTVKRTPLIAGLLVLIGMIGLLVFMLKSDHTIDSTNGNGETAIFPFTVRGNSEINYLSEGVVDLIGTKLDGMPSLKPVDPNRIFNGLNPGHRITLEKALELSKDLNADNFVLGSIVSIQDDLEISASLYDLNGDVRGKHSTTGPIQDLTRLLDDIVRHLLATDLEKEGAQVGSLAAISSTNLPAIRSFLLGEQALRSSNPEIAADHYRTATGLDSSFALAWLRLRNAEAWGTGPEDPNMLTQVRKHVHRLPSKYQDMMITVDKLMAVAPDGEAFIRDRIREHGESGDFLNELGEYLFHINPVYGRSISEAEQWFWKTRELSPLNQEVNLHLAHLGYLNQDLHTASQLLAQLDSNSIFWPTIKTIELFLQDTFTEEDLYEVANHPRFRPWTFGLYGAAPDDPTDAYDGMLRIFLIRDDEKALLQLRLSEGIFGKEEQWYDISRRLKPLQNQIYVDVSRNLYILPALFILDLDYSPLQRHYETLYQDIIERSEPWALYAKCKFSHALANGQYDYWKTALHEATKEVRTQEPATYYLFSLRAFEEFLDGNEYTCLEYIDSAHMHSIGFFPGMSYCIDKIIMRAEILNKKGEIQEAIRYYENIPVVDAYPLSKGFATYRLSQLFSNNESNNSTVHMAVIPPSRIRNCILIVSGTAFCQSARTRSKNVWDSVSANSKGMKEAIAPAIDAVVL
ncbi:MAG: adenylate/guanylate cyclase domain-containing protein, partial [Saprospiraceae bacterium]|nr:adenylate/guanylate cyclase domain-containing protein [Saprospiraceae bacterium]